MSWRPGRQNWIPPEKNDPIGLTTLVDIYGNEDPRITEVFRDGGILAQAMPGYVFREPQHRLAQHCLRAFTQRRILLAECGTGTGKSEGALVPAIIHSMVTGQPVVVSTATNVLLDQYKHKSLPMLQETLGPWLVDEFGKNFEWAALKGRSNFFCQMSQLQGDFQFQGEMDEIFEWLNSTETGDLNELSFDVHQDHYRRLKASLIADTDECPGQRKCSMGHACFYYKAKESAQAANIILVNHALLALDIMLDHQLLPEYGAVVIDEAHKFAGFVHSSLEKQISPKALQRIRTKLGQFGIDSVPLSEASGVWFSHLRDFVEKLQTKDDKINLAGVELGEELQAARLDMITELNSVECRLDAMAEANAKAGALASSICNLRQAFFSLDTAAHGNAIWIERQNEDRWSLHWTQVDLSEYLKDFLWKKFPSVLMSATLATGTGGNAFRFLKAELGIPGYPFEMVAQSPFDWEKQALYLFPGQGIIRDDDLNKRYGESYQELVVRWAGRCWPFIRAGLEFTKGKAFILCTSTAVCKALFELHQANDVPYPAVRQGGGLSKQAVVDWFMATDNPVLYATASFWEGVDIPNQQLSLVVIDKIPFPVTQSDPLEKAKSERFVDAFREYSCPVAITHLKQGLGRLLRNEKKRGILMLLDPRFRTARYGKEIAEALPGQAMAALNRATAGYKSNVKAWWAGYSINARPPISPAEKFAVESIHKLWLVRWGEGSEIWIRIADLHNQLEACGSLTDQQWEAALELVALNHRNTETLVREQDK